MPGRPYREYDQSWLSFNVTATYDNTTGVTALVVVMTRLFGQERLDNMLEQPHYFGGEQGLVLRVAPNRQRTTVKAVPTANVPTDHQLRLITELFGGATGRLCREAIASVQPGASGFGLPTRVENGRAMSRSTRGNGSVLIAAVGKLAKADALQPVGARDASEPEA